MAGVNFNNITYPFRRFFRKIKNVFRWLPTIWKDEDWDDHFIVEILIKKLEHTRDFFLSDRTHIADAEKVAEEIQEAIDRLHMTRDSFEFYESPAHDIITEKWGESKFIFKPVEHDDNLTEMIIEHENVKTLEDSEQYSKDFREAMKTARKEYIKDKKEAYKFIAKHIDKWWD
jgi:Rad3-related DNA helicase